MKKAISGFLLLLLLASPSRADVEKLGVIKTISGNVMYILQQSISDKSYFISVGGEYISLSKVRHIIRVNISHSNIRFLAILSDGRFLEGRHGRLFYQRVQYQSGAQMKSSYIPVMKGRGSEGLMVEQYDPDTGRSSIVEIVNPNEIYEYSRQVELPSGEEKELLDEPPRKKKIYIGHFIG